MQCENELRIAGIRDTVHKFQVLRVVNNEWIHDRIQNGFNNMNKFGIFDCDWHTYVRIIQWHTSKSVFTNRTDRFSAYEFSSFHAVINSTQNVSYFWMKIFDSRRLSCLRVLNDSIRVILFIFSLRECMNQGTFLRLDWLNLPCICCDYFSSLYGL